MKKKWKIVFWDPLEPWKSCSRLSEVLFFIKSLSSKSYKKYSEKALKKVWKIIKNKKKAIKKGIQKITPQKNMFSWKKWSKKEPQSDYEHVTGTWVRHPWTLQRTKCLPRGPQTLEYHKKMTPRHQNITKTWSQNWKKIIKSIQFQVKFKSQVYRDWGQ